MLEISNKLTIKYSVLLALASYSYGANAQDNMLPVPPTPQAAQFMRYGDIPVGHTTGVPQIEIPIYTISTGFIDISISISYHASGFKVNDVASPVGLGWVLNANGWQISRIVQGIPDHYSGRQKYRLDSDNTISIPNDLKEVKNGQKKINNTDFSNPGNAEFWHTYFIKNGSWPLADVRSDRYFYSFPGHMGSAQYNAFDMDLGLQTIPYEPLVFKYDTDKETYTITDTKGITYSFTQKEYNKPDGGQSIISGWYLTAIQFPGLTDVVTFTYDESRHPFSTYNYIQSDTYYNPYEVVMKNNAVDCVDPYNPIHTVHSSGYSTTPILLSEIKWKNTVVRFTYADDRDDMQKDRLTEINVINKTENNEKCIKQVKFNNNTYFGTKKENYRLKLTSIDFTYSGENYSFSYDESKNSSLPIYYGYGNCSHSTEDYWGYWNGTSSDYWVFPKEVADYYNDNNWLIKGADKIQGVDKNSNFEYAKACVLTEIKYPTKGKTRFEYELNVGNFNSQKIKPKDDKLGGLRVKCITNYSNDGSIIGIKEYEYSGKSIYSEYGKNGEFRFEDLFAISKPFVDFYQILDPGTNYSMAQLIHPSTYTSTPLQHFFDAAKSPVFYDRVTEYNGTKNNNNGRTVYYYTKACNRVSTNAVNYTGPYEQFAFVKSVDCDYGNDQGILSQQTIYDKNGSKLYDKTIVYSSYVKTLKTGVRMDMYLDVEGGNLTQLADCRNCKHARNGGLPDYTNGLYSGLILDNIIATQTYAYQTVSEPKEIIEKWYYDNDNCLEKITSYTYYPNSGLPIITQPIITTIINSDGNKHEEKNTYSFQCATTPYKEMKDKNMYEYLLKNEKSVNGVAWESTETPYQKIESQYLPKTMYKNGIQRIEYLNYDTRGNLNYAIKDGRQKVVTLYSYNYSYPVFIVEGATLEEVRKILTNNGFSSVEQFGVAMPTDEQIQTIGKALRNGLSSAMVSTYTYKLNVGVTSTIDCRGYKTIYEYDTAGRLINVWELKGNDKYLINNYKYNYSTN